MLRAVYSSTLPACLSDRMHAVCGIHCTTSMHGSDCAGL